jgi:hypothetical protein
MYGYVGDRCMKKTLFSSNSLFGPYYYYYDQTFQDEIESQNESLAWSTRGMFISYERMYQGEWELIMKRFDVLTEEWTDLPVPPVEECLLKKCHLLYHEEKLYLVMPREVIWRLDLSSGSASHWQRSNDISRAPEDTTYACVLNGKIYAIGRDQIGIFDTQYWDEPRFYSIQDSTPRSGLSVNDMKFVVYEDEIWGFSRVLGLVVTDIYSPISHIYSSISRWREGPVSFIPSDGRISSGFSVNVVPKSFVL